MSHAVSPALDILVNALSRDADGRYALAAGAERKLDKVWGRMAEKPNAPAMFAPVLKLIVALEQKFDAAATATRVLNVLRYNPATLAVLKAIRGALGPNVPRQLAWLGRTAQKTAPRFGQDAPVGSSKLSSFIDAGMQPPRAPKQFRRSGTHSVGATRPSPGGTSRRSFSVG